MLGRLNVEQVSHFLLLLSYVEIEEILLSFIFRLRLAWSFGIFTCWTITVAIVSFLLPLETCRHVLSLKATEFDSCLVLVYSEGWTSRARRWVASTPHGLSSLFLLWRLIAVEVK